MSKSKDPYAAAQKVGGVSPKAGDLPGSIEAVVEAAGVGLGTPSVGKQARELFERRAAQMLRKFSEGTDVPELGQIVQDALQIFGVPSRDPVHHAAMLAAAVADDREPGYTAIENTLVLMRENNRLADSRRAEERRAGEGRAEESHLQSEAGSGLAAGIEDERLGGIEGRDAGMLLAASAAALALDSPKGGETLDNLFRVSGLTVEDLGGLTALIHSSRTEQGRVYLREAMGAHDRDEPPYDLPEGLAPLVDPRLCQMAALLHDGRLLAETRCNLERERIPCDAALRELPMISAAGVKQLFMRVMAPCAGLGSEPPSFRAAVFAPS